MNTNSKYGIITTIIVVLGALGVAYIQSPLIDTQYEDRPILYLSLGWENDYPKVELQKNEIGYFVEIILRNDGNAAGKVILEVKSTDAKIRLGKTSNWSTEQQLPFIVFAQEGIQTYPIYVLPDDFADWFTIEFSFSEPLEKPAFQKTQKFRPSSLTYEKSDSDFILLKRDGIRIYD